MPDIGEADSTVLETILGSAEDSKVVNDLLRKLASQQEDRLNRLTLENEQLRLRLGFFENLQHKCEVCRFERLGPRERETARLIALGYPNKAIADKLSLSEKTVKNHTSAVFQKLHCNGRNGVLVRAIQQGVITREDLKNHACLDVHCDE